MTGETTRPADILCIEDSPAFALFLAMLVPGVSPRYTLADGLHALTRRKYRVVILDLVLPDSTIENTLAHIPQIAATGAKVVVITGYEVPEEALKPWNLHGYVQKGEPLFSEKLLSLIT